MNSVVNRIGWALGLVVAVVAQAQTVRDHDIQPEDYFTLSYITSSAISPHGGYVAYTESRWDENIDKRNTDVWVVEVATQRRTRLTFDAATDAALSWAPDERWIYFTSSRKGSDDPPLNGKKQVWRVSPEGGEIHAVTRLKQGVQQYELAHDGRSVYYTVGDKNVDKDAWESLRKEFDDLEYGHAVVTFSQLWKLDLESWRSEKLVDDRRVIGAFRVAPDEKRVAMVTTPDEDLISNEGWSRVDIWDAAAGTITALRDEQWREQAPSPYGWIVTPTWSTDGRRLALRVDFDGYPGEVFIASFDGGEPGIEKMARPNEVTVEGDMAFLPDTHDLCFMAEDRARKRVYVVRNLGDRQPRAADVLTPGDRVVDGFSFSRAGGHMTVLMSSLEHMGDLFAVHGPGSAPQYTRLTNINPHVDTWKLPQISIVKWTSPDGTEVEGILELPPDYQPGDGPLPTMVELHGGPTSATKYEFRFWIYGRTIYAARGWALFSPNYRGSTGYGDRFLTDLIGHKNDRDVKDILSGVDALVDRGIADPDRLAVMGWSNGGYLTNCLITTTTRFKAASSGAGVFDTAMQWMIEDTPGHVVNYQQGFPWDQTERMLAGSPLYSVDKVTTPTLIHVGAKDPRVPVEHSRGLYRALKWYLDVPCELVVYPDAAHGLTKLSDRKAKLKWDLAWFDHHVLGKSSADEARGE